MCVPVSVCFFHMNELLHLGGGVLTLWKFPQWNSDIRIVPPLPSELGEFSGVSCGPHHYPCALIHRRTVCDVFLQNGVRESQLFVCQGTFAASPQQPATKA